MSKLPGNLRQELAFVTKSYYVPYFSEFLSKFSKETIQNVKLLSLFELIKLILVDV